jgi:hypothetical protein
MSTIPSDLQPNLEKLRDLLVTIRSRLRTATHDTPETLADPARNRVLLYTIDDINSAINAITRQVDGVITAKAAENLDSLCQPGNRGRIVAGDIRPEEVERIAALMREPVKITREIVADVDQKA